LALPCSKGAIVYGAPITLDRKMDPAQEEAARQAVEAALNATMAQADNLLANVAADRTCGTAL
jgi:lysophospholipid acyltransferase (LPLAT)-like uncharacterized protein